MPSVWRIIIVLAVGAWMLGTLVPELHCLGAPCPANGLNTGGLNYDGVVTGVQPDSPASAASISPGDRIVPPWPEGLFRDPPPVVTFTVSHNGALRQVTLVPAPISWTRVRKLRFLALVLEYLIFLVVGSGILLLRPSPMTWTFYLYCVLRRFGDLLFYWPGSATIFWANFLALVALGGSTCALVAIFALRFPDDRLTGWRIVANRVAVALAIALPFAWVYAFVRVAFLSLPSEFLIWILIQATSMVYLFAAAVFVITLLRSHGDRRQRLRWILVFPVVLIMHVVAIEFAAVLPEWFADALIALAALVPLTVGYAVIRQRVFDVEFAISRALVYAAITTLIAGTFLLLDWFMSKQFAETRFTLTAEIILALAIGSWLNMLHRNVDRLVDSTFFRQRHLAEERLRKAAAAVLRAESHDVVDRFLVHEPVRALELSSAAIFRRDGATGRYVRETAVGWENIKPSELTSDDPLVLHLLAEEDPVRLAEIAWPSESGGHIGDAVLAMPVLLRDELVAIVLYGPHRNGADIDPDEIRVVALLVDRAGAAYDHIEARMLRGQVDSLLLERDAQRREIELLRASTV
ncbi:MAG TPA: hypothetical protein VEW74_09270 [Candidatus Nitrosotalea sp.]|nr:hypothetical protein [Candidatus Nitrosotalea sp.]